jgi:hypothetical protein
LAERNVCRSKSGIWHRPVRAGASIHILGIFIMQVVKFISGWKQYNAGEIAGFETVDHLINAGIAILYVADESENEAESDAAVEPAVVLTGDTTGATAGPDAGATTAADQGAGADPAVTEGKGKAGKGKAEPAAPGGDAPPQG